MSFSKTVVDTRRVQGVVGGPLETVNVRVCPSARDLRNGHDVTKDTLVDEVPFGAEVVLSSPARRPEHMTT